VTGAIERLFSRADGSPTLARCAVLFVDVLGVSAMVEGNAAGPRLVAFERALRGTYRNFLSATSWWPAAMFSDTLVVWLQQALIASPSVAR